MDVQPTHLVLTHRPDIAAAGLPVQVFSGAVTELQPRLMAAAGDKDVWVVGGGDVAAQFVAAGLVDEMIVSYAPCSLGSGAPVCRWSEWTLAETGVNGDIVCPLASQALSVGTPNLSRIPLP